MKKLLGFIIVLVMLSGCVIIRQGEVGVVRTLGKLDKQQIPPGPFAYNPFVSTIIILPTKTVNIEIRSNLPSREGLNVGSEISILYHIKADYAASILETIGRDYEEIVIKSVFRSAAADVCSRFYAKDMHTAKRAIIEREIQERMSEVIGERGFEIEAVLLKTIQLPAGLARAVEEKLEAEQDAQRMEFLLQREELEAKRKMVEAQGIRDAQKILSEGITPLIIQWQSIEAFRELAKSPNSKVIITDGKAPFLIDEK